MKRISLFVKKSQLREIKKFPGRMSEHIRRAIDDYIEKQLNASTTLTKGGD